MNQSQDGGFPWDWMYFRALDCGMDAATFWASSPRAVLLLYNRTRQVRAAAYKTAPAAAPRRSTQEPERVRLNYIPR